MRNTYNSIVLALLFGIVSCGKIDPNKQIDEGNVEHNIYKNKELGWSMYVPINWKITTRAQNEVYKEKGRAAIEQVVDGELDISGLKNLIGFQKNPFNIFQSSSEPFDPEQDGEWVEGNANLKKLLYATYQDQGIKVDSSATKMVTIDELEFESYGFTVYSPKGEVILNQIMYGRLINGIDFGVNIMYNNEHDKQEMMDSWLNSKFKK